jgi:AMP-binding enzyme/AMP-binding enzyme C-terminal domain
MAEGLLCSTRENDPADVVIETQGRPVSPEDEIRIVDDDGRAVADGEVGELQCRGPYTIRGYYNADDHNRVAFTPDGFYCTGDMVRRHPSGNLIVEGRKKDMINRGGEKISAEEIENLILAHPSVFNAAVVSMPDPVLGERACAFVILKPGSTLSLDELARFLRDDKRIAKFKLPERLETRDRFPTTAVGKVSKRDLRAEIQRTNADAGYAMTDIVDEIRQAYAAVGIRLDQPATYGAYYRLLCAGCGRMVGNVGDKLLPSMAQDVVTAQFDLYASGLLGAHAVISATPRDASIRIDGPPRRSRFREPRDFRRAAGEESHEASPRKEK